MVVYGVAETRATSIVCPGIMNFLMGESLTLVKEKGKITSCLPSEGKFEKVDLDLSENAKTSIFIATLDKSLRIVCLPYENTKDMTSDEILDLERIRDFTMFCLKKSSKKIKIYEVISCKNIYDFV